jgi:hypothetical protein
MVYRSGRDMLADIMRGDRSSLDAWWRAVSARNTGFIVQDHTTVCEVFK